MLHPTTLLLIIHHPSIKKSIFIIYTLTDAQFSTAKNIMICTFDEFPQFSFFPVPSIIIMFIHTATPFITLHRNKKGKKCWYYYVHSEKRIKNTCGFSPSSLFSYFLLLSLCTVPSFIHFCWEWSWGKMKTNRAERAKAKLLLMNFIFFNVNIT